MKKELLIVISTHFLFFLVKLVHGVHVETQLHIV